MMKLSKDLDGM
jgi:superfamily II DNA or RNA helicase